MLLHLFLYSLNEHRIDLVYLILVIVIDYLGFLDALLNVFSRVLDVGLGPLQDDLCLFMVIKYFIAQVLFNLCRRLLHRYGRN